MVNFPVLKTMAFGGVAMGSRAGIALLCPTRGTRTPFNQDLSEGLTLRPFL